MIHWLFMEFGTNIHDLRWILVTLVIHWADRPCRYENRALCLISTTSLQGLFLILMLNQMWLKCSLKGYLQSQETFDTDPRIWKTLVAVNNYSHRRCGKRRITSGMCLKKRPKMKAPLVSFICLVKLSWICSGERIIILIYLLKKAHAL